jgi:hypothetical protein
LRPRLTEARFWDASLLGGVLVALLAITGWNLLVSPALKPGTPQAAPWCLAGQVPSFQFGFGALAQQIGTAMGSPTECEHGDDSSENTLQATTTGLAVYDWCTNTPGFTSGPDHWILTPQGMEHWTDDSSAPAPMPVVRASDLRHLCLT